MSTQSQFNPLDASKLVVGQWKFSPGRLIATTTLHDACTQAEIDLTPYLNRHLQGDWGELDPFDVNENNNGLKTGNQRMLSSYPLPQEVSGSYGMKEAKIWIITEADRSTTTLLLPGDY